jgi:predicted transcriptional regulator
MNAQLITTLKELGFPRIQAQALDYFLSETKYPVFARDIELGADLRMVEAQSVIYNFMERGWLGRKELIDSTRIGRPPALYTFKLTKDGLVKYIAKTIEADAHKRSAELERLVQELG